MNQTIPGTELTAADGSSVVLRPASQGDILETRDPRGRILFEYDSSSGRAVVHFPGSEFEIQSSDGRVELVCKTGLTIRSGGTVRIESEREVRMVSGASGFAVDPERVSLEAPAADARVGEARVACGKLEQSFGRVIGWAKVVYQRIEDLMHVRAGRIRTEADKGHLVQAERARVQADGDVHIQGRTINLG